MTSFYIKSLQVDLNEAAKCVDIIPLTLLASLSHLFAHSHKIQNGDNIWPNLRRFILPIYKVGGIKTWKELTIRGALHSLEKAYEIFLEQKNIYGFLMDFSWKQKDFCRRYKRFFGSEMPLVTIGVRQLVRLLFNNNFINPGLVVQETDRIYIKIFHKHSLKFALIHVPFLFR